jgi:hypothetical protein
MKIVVVFLFLVLLAAGSLYWFVYRPKRIIEVCRFRETGAALVVNNQEKDVYTKCLQDFELFKTF